MKDRPVHPNKILLIRHSPPNQYDEATFNTECQVIDGEQYHLYRQVSKNEYKPQWEFIGTYKRESLTTLP